MPIIWSCNWLLCLFWVFGMHFLNKQKVMDSNKKFKMWMWSTVFSLNYLSFDTRDSICNLFRSIQKKRCGNSSFFVWLFCHLLKEIAIVFISRSVPSFFFNVISGNDHLSSFALQPASGGHCRCLYYFPLMAWDALAQKRRHKIEYNRNRT